MSCVFLKNLFSFLRQDYDELTDMPEELKELFAGPVHMCYNSIAGANEETGDDTGFPPAAHVMPYPAGDIGNFFFFKSFRLLRM